MTTPDITLPDHERRKFPRYYVSTRLTLAIEDESLKESIGLGEPSDISLGGLRVCNLPACPNVRVGDKLGREFALPDTAKSAWDSRPKGGRGVAHYTRVRIRQGNGASDGRICLSFRRSDGVRSQAENEPR